MAFVKKTWIARQGTNLNRFTDSLTASVMILDNTPTAVTTLGDSFTADNMNELESRIDDALQNIDAKSITIENGIESSFLKTGLITSTSEIDAIDLYAESITIEKAGSTGSVKIAIVDGNAEVTVNGQIETDHITAGGIFVTGEPSGQGVISMGDNHLGNTTATAVTADTATIGALNVNGNIVQNGSAYETHAEQVYTKDDKIILRDGAVAGLGVGQYAGFIAQKYDGTNDGNFVFDKDGIARVGDVGTEQPLATREETPIDNGIAFWNSTAQKFVTKSKATADIASDSTVVHNTGNETIAGDKSFTGGIGSAKGYFATGFSQDSLPADTEGISMYRNATLGANRLSAFIKSALGVITYKPLAIGAYINSKFSAVFNADGTVNFNFRTTSPTIPRCTFEETLSATTNSKTISVRNMYGDTSAINCKRFELNVTVPASAVANGTHPIMYMRVNNISTATHYLNVNDVLNTFIIVGFVAEKNSVIDIIGKINQDRFSAIADFTYNETSGHIAGTYRGNNTGTISAISSITLYLDSGAVFPIGTKFQLIETEII